jgi:hypothetical protein
VCKYYGVRTSSPISSYDEVAYWRNYKGASSIVRLRMIPFDAFHDVGEARGLFTLNFNQILWLFGAPLTDKIVEDVAGAVKVRPTAT